jgi:hypothetical protein
MPSADLYGSRELNYPFFGRFAGVGKGRANFPLRFYKPIYTRNDNGTIILYYKATQ